MAYLTRHPKSPYFTACFRDHENKWRRKTTGQRAKGKALLVAHKFEELHRLQREARLTLTIFRDMYDELRRQVGGETSQRKTLRAFVTEWLAGKTAKKHDATTRRYEGTARRFLELLGEKADLPIDVITPTHVNAVFDELAALGLARATLSVERATISNLFNTAIKLGLIDINPTRAVELPDKQDQVERLLFSPTQVQMLLDAADAEWRLAILFGYYCGLRLGDAVSLTWANVDFNKNQLEFKQHKTGKKLEIPLHPSLQAHLSALAGDVGGPLCPRLSATYSGGTGSLSREFIALMDRASISNESVQTAGKGKLSRLSFHALRKTFNSSLANQNVDQELRKSLTGHQSNKVNDVYTEMEQERKAKAVGLLPSLKV
jgi:integrase